MDTKILWDVNRQGWDKAHQIMSRGQSNWMISKLFHLSPLVTVQKTDQRVHWDAMDK